MRRTKRDKGTSPLRAVVGRNVRVLRDQRYRRLPNDTARNKALAQAADTTPSQIQRVILGEVGCSLDILHALAIALDVNPCDLLVAYDHLAPGIDDARIEAPTRGKKPTIQ